MKRKSPLSAQVGGSHYKAMKIQPVEYIHANGLDYIRGAVIKYVSRDRAKNGAEDIKKAIHFLELLLTLEYGDDRGVERTERIPGKKNLRSKRDSKPARKARNRPNERAKPLA